MGVGTRSADSALRAVRKIEKGTLDTLVRTGTFAKQRIDRNDADRLLILHCCAAQGHMPGIKCLLKMGADVAMEDSDRLTPLHVAAQSSMAGVEVMQLLLRAGASVDARNRHGETALHLASCSRQTISRTWNDRYGTGNRVPRTPGKETAVVRTLLEANADECALNAAGWSPVDQAKANP
ncbi:ankyrin repeat-containing domain protein [Baffinella frigidus]|nr:ankyrin repeat-containing domain protein [Cryptophyta sp. CCMP2293]